MKQLHVILLIEQGFLPTEHSLVKDVLRIADRLATGTRILCRVCTMGGTELVEGMGDVLVRASALQGDEAPRPDHLIVLGGSGVRARFSALKSRPRWWDRMGQSVILMSDAAAEWWRLNPEHDPMTTHWEKHQADCDAANHEGLTIPLYSQTGRFVTTGGMTAAADVVLATVIAPLSALLAKAVANVMLPERIRDGSDRQLRSANDSADGGQCKLHQTIAEVAKLSIGQFERKFKTFVGPPPNAFYRTLRRGKVLLEQTALPIHEIALTCGFGCTTNFSKGYAGAFGVVPSRRRAELAARIAPAPSTHEPQGPCHAPVPFSARAPRPSAHPA